jgi:hypothetical protein
MNLQFILRVILLLVFPPILYAAAITSTTKSSSISCTMQIHCPATYFCNPKPRVCVEKAAVNQTCARSVECASEKCFANICRKKCTTDNDCSLKTEFCALERYCAEKHCSSCKRNGQCANNNCQTSICERTTCLSALASLRNQ